MKAWPRSSSRTRGTPTTRCSHRCASGSPTLEIVAAPYSARSPTTSPARATSSPTTSVRCGPTPRSRSRSTSRTGSPSSRRTCAGCRRSAPASTTSTTPACPTTCTITNAAGVAAAPIAEFAIGRLAPGVEALRPRSTSSRRDHEWKPKFGALVEGLTLGVIGLGAIGTAVAVRARGVRHDHHRHPPQLPARAARTPRSTSCAAPTTCTTCSVAATRWSSSAPGTAETENLFDAAAFAAMKPGALFCNVGRGSLVDEAALIAALESGHLGRRHPRRHPAGAAARRRPAVGRRPNIYISPHCSAVAGPLHREAARAVRRQPRAASHAARSCATSSTAPPATERPLTVTATAAGCSRGAGDRRQVERAHRTGGRLAHRGDGVDDAVGRGGVATAGRARLARFGAVDGHVEVRVAGDAHAVDAARLRSTWATRARSRRRCG